MVLYYTSPMMIWTTHGHTYSYVACEIFADCIFAYEWSRIFNVIISNVYKNNNLKILNKKRTKSSSDENDIINGASICYFSVS